MSATIVAVAVATQPNHASLGPALFQLFGIIAVFVWFFCSDPARVAKREQEKAERDRHCAYMRSLPHASSNCTQEIPSIGAEMERRKDEAFHAALMRNTRKGGNS